MQLLDSARQVADVVERVLDLLVRQGPRAPLGQCFALGQPCLQQASDQIGRGPSDRAARPGRRRSAGRTGSPAPTARHLAEPHLLAAGVDDDGMARFDHLLPERLERFEGERIDEVERVSVATWMRHSSG